MEGIPRKPRQNRRILFPTPLDAPPQGRRLVGHRVSDSRVYKAVLVILAMRAEGAEDAAIADHLHLAVNTVRTYVQRAVVNGWITVESFVDPRDRVTYVLRSKAVRNIDRALDEIAEDGTMSDRASDVAIEVAKGTGLLQNYQVTKSDGQTNNNMAFQVNVVMPPDHVPPSPRAGSIGGRPAIDADIIGD